MRAVDDARRCVDRSIAIAGGIVMKYFMQNHFKDVRHEF